VASLRAVPTARLLAPAHTLGVERAADDLVANAGQVLHPAAADEHDRVLLQVVPDARDVCRDLDARREPHAGDLAQRGVGLLGRGRVDARADAAALRAALERRRLRLTELGLASLADQLLDRWHGRCCPFRRTSLCLRCVGPPPTPAVGCVARAALRRRKETKWDGRLPATSPAGRAGGPGRARARGAKIPALPAKVKRSLTVAAGQFERANLA
jgi:hypothetical protein